MHRRTPLVIAILVVVAAGAYLKHYFSPGQVVQRRLRSAVEAFEEERLLGVMPVISRAYRDPYGFDYESLAGNLKAVMDTYDDLVVDLEITALEVQGDSVRMAIRFVLRGAYQGQRGNIAGSFGEACTASLLWHRKTRGWVIASTVELDIPEARDVLQRRAAR